MSEIALAEINSFASPATQAGFESPSEQLIVLTYSQLQGLITQAVQEAIEPLQERLEALESTVDSQEKEFAAMGLKMVSLENLQEQDTNRIFLDIAHDRRRLAKLESAKEEPTDTEKERTERIEKLCYDAPNHEISLSELRGRLGIDKAVLSRLLKRINGDKFYLRKSTLDKRIRYLCLRPKVR